MNAREHAELAATLTEQAQELLDDEQRRAAAQTAAMAQAHALSALALTFTDTAPTDAHRGLIEELAPGPAG